MTTRALLAGTALLAGLLAVEGQAQTQSPATVQTQSQPSVVYGLPSGQYYLVPAERAQAGGKIGYVPRSPAADLNRGVWGEQPVTPPAGLALAAQGELIGRKVYDGGGTAFGEIERALVDPATGLAHYAIVGTPEVAGRYYIVPMSALDVENMEIGMSARDIRLMPAYDMAELERRYAPALASAPMAVGPVTLVPATPGVSAPQPAPGSATAAQTTPPYRMTQSGDWIGRAVVDPSGDLIGVVDYLLTDPATGAVRQAAVSGGSVGRGDYVLIPVENLRLSAGRLVSGQSLAALLQSPRLQQAELIQRYGPVVAGR